MFLQQVAEKACSQTGRYRCLRPRGHAGRAKDQGIVLIDPQIADATHAGLSTEIRVPQAIANP